MWKTGGVRRAVYAVNGARPPEQQGEDILKLAKLALALALIGTAPVPSQAHDYKVGSLEIARPWARATPPRTPVAGGYLTITNNGAEPDRLLRGSSEAAKAVQIHESTITAGVARMRPAENGIVIAPGKTLELKPGAAHIMFVEPTVPLKDGGKFSATLSFEKAGEVAIEFAIMPMGAVEAPQNHGSHEAAASR